MKTNLKKILSAILAFTAVVCASGCNIVTEDDTPNNSSSAVSPSDESTSSPDSSSTPESSSAVPDLSTDSSSATETSSQSVMSSSTATQSTGNKADNDGEMSGTVLVLNNTGRGIVLFGGGKEGGKDYAQTVSSIKAQVGGDVKFYSMVAPTSGSFYLPDNLKNKMASEPDNIDNINQNLVGVTPVDAYTALSKHTSEDIYFRTDHHWTQLGAYYAAEEFAKVAGVPFAPLSEYEKFEREGYLGSLYGYSNENATMRKNPDKFTFYKPKNNYTVSIYSPQYKYKGEMSFNFNDKSTYMIYGMDNQINYVKTDCTNGRKLVIVGDSYDNALFLNLTNSFEEIWVCDMRETIGDIVYCDVNIVDFIKKMGATDVLFNMDTFSAVGTNRNGLKRLLENKNTVE